MGTREGDTIGDIQGSQNINPQLSRTCMEHQAINSSNTSMNHIHVAQNAALKLATGSHQMSSIDHLYLHSKTLNKVVFLLLYHLYQEAKMLEVQEHQ